MKVLNFDLPSPFKGEKLFSQRLLDQRYYIAHELFILLQPILLEPTDKVLSRKLSEDHIKSIYSILRENNIETNYDFSYLQRFHGYVAFYFPDDKVLKKNHTALKQAGYGIAITNTNGLPHTHLDSEAVNIILNPARSDDTVGFFAGDSRQDEKGFELHGKELFHGDRLYIERGFTHGHIVQDQCRQYRDSKPDEFPMRQMLLPISLNRELTFFFLQLCDFTDAENSCYEDFHIKCNEEYFNKLYTLIYHRLLEKYYRNYNISKPNEKPISDLC